MSNPLRFNQLTAANQARQGEFQDYYNIVDNWTPLEWSAAAGGELGELQNLLKKVRRGDKDITQYQVLADVASEIADVIIYLDLLAYKLNIDLGQAVAATFNNKTKKLGLSTLIDSDNHKLELR